MNVQDLLPKFPERSRRLVAALRERILVIDGAMGTMIQQRNPTAEDWGGDEYVNCSENLLRSRPEWIRQIHADYLAAGADLVETNTFGATPLVLGEFGLQDLTREMNLTACKLAREACDQFSTLERPRFVAGSVGPTTKQISLTVGFTFERQADNYTAQMLALIEGGADVILIETAFDTLNIKAALEACDRAFEQTGIMLPIMVSVTIDPTLGMKMLAGQDVEAAYVSLAHRPLLSIGMNCATGPDALVGPLRTLATYSRFYTSLYPNAGLPDADNHYHLTPDGFVAKAQEFLEKGWVNIVGGCCGTTPEHIRRLSAVVGNYKPRVPNPIKRTAISGMEALEIAEDGRPWFVGERTNSLGSRMFKRLIQEEKIEEAVEIGRKQVRAGAHVLDLCLQNPDRDEPADMSRFLDLLTRRVYCPFMVDSTDEKVLEISMKRIQGKVIYNSINLEDGEERFHKVVPLVKKFGAALIVGCIDEDKKQGMAVTRQRKLEVAARCHELLTKKYDIPEEDLIFDPLVFPIGTGDENYKGAGRETIEGLRLIKQRFPYCKTTLGISNVSFGLPEAGREVLNSVFLHLNVEAGLDLPIVNTQKLVPYSQIPPEDKKVCLDLIDNTGPDPIAAFVAQFRERKTERKSEDRLKLSIDERLPRNVIEGSKDGLIEDLDELLKSRKPLDIVNGPLMAGMDEVGRLFNNNEMIVAEVLQSAEVMKAAVAHLEPHMEKADAAARGTMVLATVKGDVHDIGKSLVEIIFSNNGFKVVDLGIKVLSETLIAASREHKADMIGLSGLLVKSAQQMVLTAEDFKRAGVNCPVLVGGAALSDTFTRSRIAPAYGSPVFYARDAMDGLDLANRVRDPEKLQALWKDRQAPITVKKEVEAKPAVAPAQLDHGFAAPVPPDLKRHVLADFDLEEVVRWINPLMLYGKHLGLKGNIEKLAAQGDAKARDLKASVERMIDTVRRDKIMTPKAVYRFFPALAHGNDLVLYKTSKKEEALAGGAEAVITRFAFPRQTSDRGLCLSDYVRGPGAEGLDYVALFATTCGEGVRARAEQLKKDGRYVESIVLQALAIESAEGLAELVHARLRAMWGFPDAAGTSMQQRFQAKYRGIRVSFGYPACPRLEDQALLFPALDVEAAIGVRLTEEYMMDPEASVSALVFHHPEARYFGIKEEDLKRFEAERLGEASA